MNSYIHKWKHKDSLHLSSEGYQRALFHRVQTEIDIIPEDMVALVGQDIMDQEKTIDRQLYVERLITNVSS